jgi:hypothetical protein
MNRMRLIFYSETQKKSRAGFTSHKFLGVSCVGVYTGDSPGGRTKMFYPQGNSKKIPFFYLFRERKGWVIPLT